MDKFSKSLRQYCGKALKCIGVSMGDTYDKALSNINDIICDLSDPYIFEENECGGFTIKNRKTEEVIFENCVEDNCCGPTTQLYSSYFVQVDKNPSLAVTLRCFIDLILESQDCAAISKGGKFLADYSKSPSSFESLQAEFNNGLKIPIDLSSCIERN